MTMKNKTLRLLIPMILILVAANFLAFSVDQLTITKLLLGVAVLAGIFTVYANSQEKLNSLAVSFTQYFTGILFGKTKLFSYFSQFAFVPEVFVIW